MSPKKLRTAKWETKALRIANIEVDSYQRELNEARSREIAEDWNELLYTPPKISHREGRFYAVDGQHTIAAANIKFGDQHELLCLIQNDLTYEQEAATFAAQRKHSRPLGAMDTFNAEREAKDPGALKVDKIVRGVGMQVDTKHAGGEKKIRAIKALRDAEEKHGNLEVTLKALSLWMDGNVAVFNPKIIGAVSLLLSVYGDAVKQERLLKVLSNTHPTALLLDMKQARSDNGGRHSVSATGARLLRERYNKLSRVNHLPAWAKATAAVEE